MHGVFYTTEDYLIEEADFPEYKIYPLESVDYKNLDDWMHKLVQQDSVIRQNIFIPLCFGQIWSDFLGLRLAMHYRTTLSVNQCANLFIYGTESIESLIHEEFFSIFETKGVLLVDYNLYTLVEHAKTDHLHLNNEGLTKELLKLQVQIPANLYDNHSVSNIWGMYRILELEDIDPLTITAFNDRKNKLNNIYFKWLRAKNVTNALINDEVIEVKRDYTIKISGPTILGKIDLPKRK